MKFHPRFLLAPAALSLTLVLGACASVAPAYQASKANQAALANIHGAQVAVGAFTQPADISTTCRDKGPVEPPNKLSFASYVQGALSDELKAAGKLDPSSGVTLTGQLTKVDFSSTHNLVEGYWDLNLALHSSNGRSLSVAEHYDFGTNLIDMVACQDSANALPKAVDALIHKAVSSPDFPALLMKN